MTKTTMPATWADVTLGEFDALDLLRSPDPVHAVHTYWDALHAMPENVFRGQEPSRLTAEGVAWLTGLRAELLAGAYLAADATAARRIAQDVLRLGTLTIVNAARVARERMTP